MRTTPIQTHMAVFGLLAILVVAAPSPSPAINPGDTNEGQWMGGTEQYDSFTGDQGDYVSFILLDVNNEAYYRPGLKIYNAGGTLIQTANGERAAVIRNFRLPQNGTYYIVIGGSGIIGRIYDGVLSFVKTNDPNDGGDLSYGAVYDGTLSPDGDIDGFRFAAESGDKVTIVVDDTDGLATFSPYIDLVGPNGLVTQASGGQTASISNRELSAAGDYSIFVWGGEPNWGGGAYELTLIDAGSIPTPTPTPIPLPMPDMTFASADAGPTAPVRIHPGEALSIGAFIENLGQPAGPFWVEFWGSRTGGLTLDEFLTESLYIPGLPLQGTYPYEQRLGLYSIPDGPYTVVMVIDRPNMVTEWNEANNRAVVSDGRVLTLRPPQNIDLAVQWFDVDSPLQAGGLTQFRGVVQNIGTENSGFFWIEFWSSPPAIYPELGTMIADSIPVDNLAPGEYVDLSMYPRPVYQVPPSTGHVGVFADRTDWVRELDETNNYLFVRDVNIERAGEPAVFLSDSSLSPSGETGKLDILYDLEVQNFNFWPESPTELQPGQLLNLDVTIANQGPNAAQPFYLEFWGSQTGGLTLDDFLVDSVLVNGLNPGEARRMVLAKNLYAIPDGPYTVVAAADRLGSAGDFDLNWLNNRKPVAGKQLLTIRPVTQANLVVEGFDILSSPTIQAGQLLSFLGQVRNTGSQTVGHFWIEFWISGDQMYPTTDWYLCESIYISGLGPGGVVPLSTFPRIAYNTFPTPGSYSIGCFADATDLINETDETDNYQFRPGAWLY